MAVPSHNGDQVFREWQHKPQPRLLLVGHHHWTSPQMLDHLGLAHTISFLTGGARNPELQRDAVGLFMETKKLWWEAFEDDVSELREHIDFWKETLHDCHVILVTGVGPITQYIQAFLNSDSDDERLDAMKHLLRAMAKIMVVEYVAQICKASRRMVSNTVVFVDPKFSKDDTEFLRHKRFTAYDKNLNDPNILSMIDDRTALMLTNAEYEQWPDGVISGQRKCRIMFNATADLPFEKPPATTLKNNYVRCTAFRVPACNGRAESDSETESDEEPQSPFRLCDDTAQYWRYVDEQEKPSTNSTTWRCQKCWEAIRLIEIWPSKEAYKKH